MSAPAVSVVLPTFNRTALLPRAMASVLSQDFRDLELIVVDDRSTEDVRSVVEAAGDARVRYLLRERNGGAAATRNTGIAAASGEFVAFIDSDDEWLPGKLRRQLEALRAAGAGIGAVVCDLLRWTGASLANVADPRELTRFGGDLRRVILHRNFALTSSWLVRRSTFDEIGSFDDALSPLEDWEWLIRYCERHPLLMVPDPLAVIYESLDSISANHERYVRALRGIIVKHEASLAGDSESLGNLHYVLGRKLCLGNEMRSGRAELAKALRIHPGDWRAWAALALSFAGGRWLRRLWRTARPAGEAVKAG